MDDIGAVVHDCIGFPPTDDVPLSSPHSLLSIPSVVVTISILANPQQSGGTHQLVVRSVSLPPDVPADCAEPRPCRRRRTKSHCLLNKNLFEKKFLVSALLLSTSKFYINLPDFFFFFLYQ